MLELQKVIKSFSGNFNPILKGIDLALLPGDFCILIGSNGSGKSTLMKCVSGEYVFNSGKIIVSKGASIACVTQDINKGTIAEMTLLENMTLSKLYNKKAKFNFYSNKLNEVIEEVKELGVDLAKYIDEPLGNLSGGQRQMIATIMAINSKPDILLLDEHTSALDPKTQNFIMDYTIKNIEKNKITTMMITHKFDDAIAYGNRLVMLHQGEIVVDLKGDEKKKLSVSQLLQIFHQYEDLSLRGKNVN